MQFLTNRVCYKHSVNGLGAPDRIFLLDYVGWGKIVAMCGTTVMGVFLLEKVFDYHRRVGKLVPVLIRAVTEKCVLLLACLFSHPSLFIVCVTIKNSVTSTIDSGTPHL